MLNAGNFEQQWPADEDGVTDGECESCHQRTLVKCVPDPYIAEIHPDEPNPPSYVCYPCFHERCMDI